MRASIGKLGGLVLASLAVVATVYSGYVAIRVARAWGELHEAQAEVRLAQLESAGTVTAAGAGDDESVHDRAGGISEMDNVDLLMRLASEAQVEIVSLLRPDGGEDHNAGRITYRVRVRAHMERLEAFLERMQNAGLDRVVIDRLAARRQGNAWETDLEVTSYFRPPDLAPAGASRAE